MGADTPGNGAPATGAAVVALHDLVSALPDPVLLTDRSGRVALANDEAVALLGPHLGAAAAQFGAGGGDVAVTCDDGTTVTVEVRSRPLSTDGHEFVVHTLRDVTERRQTEERYRVLSELVSDMAYVATIDERRGIVLDWVSDSFQRITGFGAVEWRERGGWGAAVPPDYLAQLGDDIAALRRGEPIASEGPIVTKGGDRCWLRSWAMPVVDPATGAVTRIYGAAQDITDHKRAELALAESEKLLREAESLGRLGNWRWDTETGAVRWSDEMYRIHGFDPAHGAPPAAEVFFARVDPAARDALFRATADHSTGLGSFSIEYRFRRPDGSLRWIESRGRRAETAGTAGGTVWTGTAQDVTERRDAEERYRAVSTLTSDVAFAFRVDGEHGIEVVWTTSQTEHLTGYPVGELAGPLDWTALAHPDDHETVLGALRAVMAGTSTQFDLRIVRKDGDLRWLRLSVRPSPHENGMFYGAAEDITERKQAEERYRVVSELTSDVAYSYHLDETGWPVVDWITDGMERITGYSTDESIALGGWPAMLAPEDRDAYDLRVLRVLDGESVTEEFRIVTKDGATKWLRISATPVTDARTGHIRVFGAAQDVTRQKRAEHALAESEARLRAAQQLARLGSWRLDLPSDAVEWSDELYLMAGYEVDSFQPTATFALDMIHPSDRGALRRAVEEAVDTGEAVELEYRFFTRDGSMRWVTARTEAVVDERGAPVAVRGTCLDITERKEEEERYKAISGLVSDVAYSFRIEAGRAVPEWITEAYSRLTGYTDERALDILVHRRMDIVHPDDWDIVKRSTANAVAGNEDVCEYRLVTKSGNQRWMRAYARPIVDDATGEVVRVVGAAQDITEHRRVEEALRRAYHRERSAALELRRADRLKDEFLTTASHELRTPLTTIVGFASALARQGDALDDATRHEIIGKLERNALELGHMVERLLDFSRLQSGTAKVEPRCLDAADAVARCLETQALALAGHEVHCDLPDGMDVWADLEGFQHVLGNLLTNAAKYSPPGSTIEVVGRVASDAVLSVRDRGQGIDPAVRDRLFERFYRGPDQPAGQRGSGVGLAIARTYVELMGGQIWVESEPGRGSVFSFSLPRPPAGTAAPTAAGSSPGRGTRAPAR